MDKQREKEREPPLTLFQLPREGLQKHRVDYFFLILVHVLSHVVLDFWLVPRCFGVGWQRYRHLLYHDIHSPAD